MAKQVVLCAITIILLKNDVVEAATLSNASVTPAIITDPVTPPITTPPALTVATATNSTEMNTSSPATNDARPPTTPTASTAPSVATAAAKTSVPTPLDKLSIVQILQGLLGISKSLVNQLLSMPTTAPAVVKAFSTTMTSPTTTGTANPNEGSRKEILQELRQLYLDDPLAFFHQMMGLPPRTEPSSTTTVPTTTTSTRPPWPEPNCGNPRISNWLRQLFLNTHNNLRGSVARGQTERSMGWGIAPPATVMYRMKYDCEAESHAQQYVSACRTNGLPDYTHPGYKVNRHVLYTVQTDQAGAAQNAMATWWSQLARFGMRSNMMFYYSEYSRGASNVLSWSKMAWWNNVYIGCAVQHCGVTYYTACMYKPGGNYVNQYVYKVGRVCSDCPSGQCDYQALCRW